MITLIIALLSFILNTFHASVTFTSVLSSNPLAITAATDKTAHNYHKSYRLRAYLEISNQFEQLNMSRDLIDPFLESCNSDKLHDIVNDPKLMQQAIREWIKQVKYDLYSIISSIQQNKYNLPILNDKFPAKRANFNDFQKHFKTIHMIFDYTPLNMLYFIKNNITALSGLLDINFSKVNKMNLFKDDSFGTKRLCLYEKIFNATFSLSNDFNFFTQTQKDIIVKFLFGSIKNKMQFLTDQDCNNFVINCLNNYNKKEVSKAIDRLFRESHDLQLLSLYKLSQILSHMHLKQWNNDLKAEMIVYLYDILRNM